jgi:hypothetical protein
VYYRYFANRVEPSAEAALVCLGRRTLATGGRIIPIGRLAALRQLTPDCAVGLGRLQGLELFLPRSAREIAARFPVAVSRLHASWASVRRSKLVEPQLGRDVEGNARLLLDYARGL